MGLSEDRVADDHAELHSGMEVVGTWQLHRMLGQGG